MIIYGAGLSGLIAASLLPGTEIHEAATREVIGHKALLRFRSPAVGDAVGIEFKKVRVHKGIWYRGEFREPNIQLANWYSEKVIGSIGDRSIWNTEATDRYIAPEDFSEQLIDRLGNRIKWEHPLTGERARLEGHPPIISTIPMYNLARMLRLHDKYPFIPAPPQFKYSNITVRRVRLKDCDVYQTIYFPDPATSTYRASITGNLLIVEGDAALQIDYDGLLLPFGLSVNHIVEELPVSKHNHGKILPIDETWRRMFVHAASTRNNIYSLGRFATWRNILVDDVLKDVGVVRRLIATSGYERARLAANTGRSA